MTQSIIFASSVQAMLSGREVRASIGIKFDFTSGSTNVWLGQGTVTHSGSDWLGLGRLASIDGMQMTGIVSTDPITMTLSGIDTALMNEVRNQATEIRGRSCYLYLLMFDSDWQPLDSAYLIEVYLMDKATFSVDGETNQMIVTLTAEPLFASKHIPPVAFMSDQDQKRKYPNDRIFDRVVLQSGRQTVIWTS